MFILTETSGRVARCKTQRVSHADFCKKLEMSRVLTSRNSLLYCSSKPALHTVGTGVYFDYNKERCCLIFFIFNFSCFCVLFGFKIFHAQRKASSGFQIQNGDIFIQCQITIIQHAFTMENETISNHRV